MKHLLNKVSHVQIYENFCKDYTTKKNISSPFADVTDKNPSFRFYENGTFKCHSSGRQGDAIQFVADLNGLDCKTQFLEIQKIILDKIGNPAPIPPKTNEIKTENNHFNFQVKQWDKQHFDYWNQGNWNVKEELLKTYNVSPLDKFQYWNKQKNQVQKIKIFSGILSFVYQVNGHAEIYIPKQEKNKKFFYNQLEHADVFGYQQLKKENDYLIISAGKKDCLILNANGFPSVSFKSENHFIKPNQVKQLQKKAKKIFICYDNDTPGQTKQKEWTQKYGFTPIFLPKEFNDIADFFQVKHKGDFQEILNNVINFERHEKTEIKAERKDGEVNTIFHQVEEYLAEKYDFRFNSVILDIQYKLKTSKKWEICNEDSIYIELQKRGINVQMSKLLSVLKSDFVPKFNPIQEYFNELKEWDGEDYIKQLCQYVQTPTPNEFYYHLKKWLARAVKTMLIDGYFNKQAFILTDKGQGQNIGKSHFTKWLCTPNLPSNRSFEDSKKDNLIKLATNCFIILDELDGITKKDLNSLKALFSMDEIRVRLPYARREETVQRIANFIGSTNEETFLTDPTGSVRWLIFHVSAINWEYSKAIDINDIWAQAYALAKDINFDETFNSNDVKENEERNKSYQVRTPAVELLNICFKKPETIKEELFYTTTEILMYLQSQSSLRLNSKIVGQALKSEKYERVKRNGVYGYLVAKTGKNPLSDMFSPFN